MKINVGVSNRHVHLTKEDLEILFGNNYELSKKADIKQPGQYAANETVIIKTDKDIIENVRVLGPIRSYTQVELSKTDAYKLGINPPLRNSGEVEDASVVTIIGPIGEITKPCAILVRRHIHITKEDKEKYNLPDMITVGVNSERGGVLNNVQVKVSDEAYLEMHIDTDEANAFNLKNNDEVEIKNF